MGNLVVSTNITVNGGAEDPVGDEGRIGGGWFNRVSEADRVAWADVATAEAQQSEALLFGRRSYEWFAPRWSVRVGGLADRLNAIPKYVVSSTLEDPTWTNTTVLSGVAQEQVAALKDAIAGDIVVYGSGRLVTALVDHDLVDELRLMIFPCLLGGGGHRLFSGINEVKDLEFVETRAVGASIVYLIYSTIGSR